MPIVHKIGMWATKPMISRMTPKTIMSVLLQGAAAALADAQSGRGVCARGLSVQPSPSVRPADLTTTDSACGPERATEVSAHVAQAKGRRAPRGWRRTLFAADVASAPSPATPAHD